MTVKQRIGGAGVVAAGVAATLGACQTYEAKPLQPEVHRTEWLARTPESASEKWSGAALAPSVAPSIAPSVSVTLEQAEIVALVYNPDLRLARLRVGVAEAIAEHAGAWDDPEFMIDVLSITESVPNPWVITPGLAITIPISGRLEAAAALADASRRVEVLRVAEEEWRVRRDVRQAWLNWSAATLQANETRQSKEALETLALSTDRLAAAGEMARTEAALFGIAQAQRQQELVRLQGESAAAEQRLRMLMGISPQAPMQLAPTLEIGAIGEGALVATTDGSTRSLRLQTLREEFEVAERALELEIREQYPDLTVGPLFERDQGQSRIGFLGAIPIPAFNANKGGIAEAMALREVARGAYEAAAEQLEGELAVARFEWESLHSQFSEFQAAVFPVLERQVRDATTLLEMGEGDAMVLLEGLDRAHAAHLFLIEVERNLGLVSAEIEYLLGPEQPVTIEGVIE